MDKARNTWKKQVKSLKFRKNFPDFSRVFTFGCRENSAFLDVLEPRFTGTYEGNKGQGELVEMFGFGVATVDDQLRRMGG